MPRSPRTLHSDYTYHITVRCNNRQFNLNRPPCRDILLYAIQKAKDKFNFSLYALCIMSNHVHYLLQPADPNDLPRIMHWLNWYAAMCFNRMLNRTGHFWEQRYFSAAFPANDHQRALNTLRYIHANPKAAGITNGFTYRYSNYGTYASLTDDGLTCWHPAFLALGDSLDECAARYRDFCRAYQPSHKAGGRRASWGRICLPDGLQHTQKRIPYNQATFPLAACQAGSRSQAIFDRFPLLKAANTMAQRFKRANSLSV